tara:strand:- start:15 stop:482 length:468 start_codon:yes stop_codon:yes gene_type:complete
MNALTQWFEQLSEKDKKVVQISTPVVLVLVLIFAVVLPINSSVSALRADVIDNKKATILLQAEAPQNQSGGGKQSYSSLTNVITSTTRQHNFRLERFEEKRNGEINVWFDQIGFDKMLSWLAQLENQYGITTSYISVSQSGETGMVRANVRLVSG